MSKHKGLIRCRKKGAKHFKYIYVHPDVVNNLLLMEQLGLEKCEEKNVIFVNQNIPTYAGRNN